MLLQAPDVFAKYNDVNALIPLIYRLALRGVNICAQNSHGNTCLHLACIRPHADKLCSHLIRIGKCLARRLRIIWVIAILDECSSLMHFVSKDVPTLIRAFKTYVRLILE